MVARVLMKPLAFFVVGLAVFAIQLGFAQDQLLQDRVLSWMLTIATPTLILSAIGSTVHSRLVRPWQSNRVASDQYELLGKQIADEKKTKFERR